MNQFTLAGKKPFKKGIQMCKKEKEMQRRKSGNSLLIHEVPLEEIGVFGQKPHGIKFLPEFNISPATDGKYA